ncbi:MAG: triose-phosphate isomerase [Candidatus Nealsonbacteria bacterium RIFCSPLOWO2_01_FULL_43_32]|uniref:Triosephosphate isomerase n=1 Tax=Candidatus Nealsonbacteria bacterium RIFCSPLOWO2_01_FULL_43_32 TaxID=1801672 RepID=A0A1G2EGY3_9BACT|nr:MAG: triose-phosphate isomerase [Candidatus Nealsonbacteria bacterium RIFCSPLOWO2_01_FULL_43_32]
MEKPLIIANWKCNPITLAEAKRNFELIKENTKTAEKVEIVICAPFVFLPILKPSENVKLGAQDCFWEDRGPFTGEVSPKQLVDVGCQYVILGHSERRRYLAEKTEAVNQKIKAALGAGLKVIFCVGSETKIPGEEMEYQLTEGLKGLDKRVFDRLILVYEPVWAISTTKEKVIATPKEAQEGGLYMRKILASLFDAETAKAARVIYGGSVDSKNIRGFLDEGEMAGGLVGAASLKSEEFIDIIKNACYPER